MQYNKKQRAMKVFQNCHRTVNMMDLSWVHVQQKTEFFFSSVYESHSHRSSGVLVLKGDIILSKKTSTHIKYMKNKIWLLSKDVFIGLIVSP